MGVKSLDDEKYEAKVLELVKSGSLTPEDGANYLRRAGITTVRPTFKARGAGFDVRPGQRYRRGYAVDGFMTVEWYDQASGIAQMCDGKGRFDMTAGALQLIEECSCKGDVSQYDRVIHDDTCPIWLERHTQYRPPVKLPPAPRFEGSADGKTWRALNPGDAMADLRMVREDGKLVSVRTADGKVTRHDEHGFDYAYRLAMLEAEDGAPIRRLPSYNDRVPNYHPGETGAGIKAKAFPPARVPFVPSCEEPL